MDCYRTVAPVNVPNLAQAADRWPRFAAAAGTGELVFRAVHAVPLRLRGRAIGALNLFSRQPRAIPSGDLALAQALADVATIAILQERTIHRAEGLSERLQIALTSRVVIEQAKGVLAHYSGLSMDQVFDEMRCHARLHNRRLSDVAHAVAERTLHPGVVLSPNPAPTSGT
jgi:GAF domain-containing protein